MISSKQKPVNAKLTRVVVHWPRLGAYHVARLEAATEVLSMHNICLVALDTCRSDKVYLWETFERVEGIERRTLFPNTSIEDVSPGHLFQELWHYLNKIRPAAIAINGYSSWDAQILLLWCRLNDGFPILMSDSTWNDAPRNPTIEYAKSMLVRQYGAAVCAGSPQKKYLEGLGMAPERIFMGYDAVDNRFFEDQSDRARQTHEKYRSFPGLEEQRPFFLASGRFIPRKNFLGLLRAYKLYKQLCWQNKQAPWRLVLLGDGPERAMIQSDIRRLGIVEDVTLAGVQTNRNLPAYYGLASAFIHPALQDQWGLVVNEAMAAGLPVLASERAGCSQDLIEAGIEGYSFDPNDMQRLSYLMHQMSSGQVDLARMSAAARQKISRWGVDRFAASLYKAILVGLS